MAALAGRQRDIQRSKLLGHFGSRQWLNSYCPARMQASRLLLLHVGYDVISVVLHLNVRSQPTPYQTSYDFFLRPNTAEHTEATCSSQYRSHYISDVKCNRARNAVLGEVLQPRRH